MGDLHGDVAESYRVKGVVKRVRHWLVGKIPRDSVEVELFAHFRNRSREIEYLIPEIFFDEQGCKGIFYAGLPYLIATNRTENVSFKKVYMGTCIVPETQAGVILSPLVTASENLTLFTELPQTKLFTDPGALGERQRKIRDEELIEGFWWDIAYEPQPFDSIDGLGEYVGGGDKENGVLEIALGVKDHLGKRDYIHLGLRFPARPTAKRNKDWLMLRLIRGSRPVILSETNEELVARLKDYSLEAVNHELFTEEYFHLRNSGRATRDLLKNSRLSIIGCGALGSEIGDCLCKAGVGSMLLTDKEQLKSHNTIRHLLGLSRVTWPKSLALGEYLVSHNPFVEVKINEELGNILSAEIDKYLPETFIGVSTIADDNVEAYLNENAVDAGRVVFYCRALRGGKAGRIFRVIPWQDACKACLSLYRSMDQSQFVDIPEDPTLPVITNECNNPVRPGSAADLKIIAALVARVIVDYLQGTNTTANHWIWNTESLEGLKLGQDQTAAMHAQTILPHPDCPVCRKMEDTTVSILKDAYDLIKNLAKESNDIETGGILIGTYDSKGLYLVQRATGPGPNAVRTAAAFEKDVEYCQNQLAKITQELGEDALYLGEWHYHPTISNEPSGTDIKSLMEIAEQDNYLIARPIMVIISKTFEVGLSLHAKSGRWVKLGFNIVDAGA